MNPQDLSDTDNFEAKPTETNPLDNVEISEALSYKAYAKINLSLEVLGKRLDGYHNLATVMQTVNLYDQVRITPASDLEFDCSIAELVDENNLVWRAALQLFEKLPEENKQGARIMLEKSIPVAAGLGGGSSDAATTLMALNDLWGLNLSRYELLQEAAQLGSDVPFFIYGGTVLAEGRGEELTQLPNLKTSWVVLLNPDLELPTDKTAQLYKALYRSDYSEGSITRQLVSNLETGQRPSPSLLFNTFERVAYEQFPQLDMYRHAMVSAGADYVRVSGSGPTLFTLLDAEEEGEEIVQNLQAEGLQAFLVETV